MVANAAVKAGTPLSEVATYLSPAVGGYIVHASEVNTWISPVAVLRTKVSVFKKFMQISNGKVLLSCISTGALCALQVIPGPQQAPAIFVCQTLVVFTNNVN